MNIDEMQAGPELDALIATEVMGLIVHPRNTGLWVPQGPADGIADHTPKIIGGWLPSTNIAHAMEVVEKMRLQLVPCVDEPHWFVCEGDCVDHGKSRFGTIADTAPLAICRAALKAVRG